METRTRDKRKILLVLPLLVMPLLALAFYAAGGGRGNADAVLASTGINTALPDADFRTEEPVDKMGFYARGKSDSSGSDGISVVAQKMGFGNVAGNERTAEINAKLAALDREINSPAEATTLGGGKSPVHPQAQKQHDGGMKADVDRLEMLMGSMKADKGTDPEMEQLNAMLEKLLDIQQPGRSQQKVVSKIYGDGPQKEFLAVPAEIADGGKVVQGSTIRLRLLDTVVLHDVTVPKGHFVYGLCRLVN